MKHNYTVLLFALLFGMFSTQAQDITFSFDNAVITTDGTNDFYEADIMIESTADFIAGSGLLYFNYNNAAFGTNISDGGTVEITYPDTSYICGNKDNTVGTIDVYGPFVQNDNTSSRFAFSFQQAFGYGSMNGNNVTATPAKLFRLKIQYINSAIDPMMTFEGNPPFDDQFFTACGPNTPLTPANCSTEPGTQILNDFFESSGSAPAPLSVENFSFQNLKIYPNPAKNEFKIVGFLEKSQLEIYSLSGQLVLSQTDYNGENVDVSNLLSAIYFVKISNSKGAVVKRLIRE